MTEINQKEEVEIIHLPVPVTEVTRSPEEQANFDHWDKLSESAIRDRVGRLDFIVDRWGILDQYAGIQLPEGWSLITTSRHSHTVGTILLSTTDPVATERLQRSIKTYVANHGLRLAQADTFIETLYYAKFAILPLLSVVLADNKLYRAYRNYSREKDVKQYVAWIHEHDLQNSEFNAKLAPTDRIYLAEMLYRMTRADLKLREVRAANRANFKPRNRKKPA